MNKREKVRFLRSLTKQVADHLVRQVDKMPEHWDGHDLRELLAASFEYERTLRPQQTLARNNGMGERYNARRRRRFNRERLEAGIRVG